MKHLPNIKSILAEFGITPTEIFPMSKCPKRFNGALMFYGRYRIAVTTDKNTVYWEATKP